MTNPEKVEERLRGFAIERVEQAIDAFSNDDERIDKLLALSQRFGSTVETFEIKRQNLIPQMLALSKSETCQEKCEFSVSVSEVMDTALLHRVANLRVGQSTLKDFIHERYEATVQGLRRDLLRFGLVNGLVLSLLLSLTAASNRLDWRLSAFSAALAGYTAWASYHYIYTQNWALSILFQDWTAPTYQASMLLCAAFLFDLLFLKGRITQAILNAIATILPS